MDKIDDQILKLIELLKSNEVIRFDVEFSSAIGLRKQNLSLIRAGKTHFTITHLQNIIDRFGVNPSWIFGQSEKVFNKIAVNTTVNID